MRGTLLVAQLVEKMLYKPEGRGFDCNRNEYQECFLGGEGDRRVGLKPYHPYVPIVSKSGSLSLIELSLASPGLNMDSSTFYCTNITWCFKILSDTHTHTHTHKQIQNKRSWAEVQTLSCSHSIFWQTAMLSMLSSTVLTV
jgi:hypothetical protein